MNKRILVFITIGILVLSSLSVLAGCNKSAKTGTTAGSQPPPDNKIKVAYYGGTCEAPVYIAYEKGFFKNHGLDAELVKVDFNTLKLGLASGNIDAVQLTAGDLKPIEQGLNIKITNGVHTGCIQAVVPIDSKIQSVKDLKGKNIGVESMGGMPMTLLSVDLGKNGVNYKSDVTWKVFPAPQLAQALDKGEVDAFITWDPFGQLAIDSGKARRIFSNTYTPGYTDIYCCFIGIGGNRVKEQPAKAKAITEALQDAAIWVGQNPAETAQIAIEKKYTAGDLATAAKLLSSYTFKPDAAKAKESLRFYLKGLKDQQILNPDTDPDKLLDSVFVSLP